MITPVDSLVYLYYECSKCSMQGDSIRLKQAMRMNSHICPFCENIDDIKPIKGMTVIYDSKVKVESTKTTNDKPVEYDKVLNLLKKHGYGVKESKETLNRIYKGGVGVAELFKEAVLELDNEQVEAG